MAKKSFADINIEKQDTGVSSGEVFEAAERGVSQFQQQGTASPAEQAARAAEMRTQGRKGCKLPRINLAFTPENHRFIKITSRALGMSMTEFTNLVISRYADEHPELYEKSKALIASIDE